MSALESFQIHLTSQNADKVNNNNNCDVEFYLPVIEIPSQFHIYISVQHAVIPFTFYNVNSSNNILNYSVNSISYQLIITQGNYNVNTMKTFLSANMAGFTISYNNITNQFTFTHSTYDFSFLSTSTCFSLIGLLSQTNTSTSRTLVSNRAVNLAPIRCICVMTNLKTFNIDKTQVNNNNTICSIPIITQPYSIITFQNQNNFRVNTYTNTISTLAIKLMDQTGRLLDLNGANWSMTLQFDVVDFVQE
jgi:hypothetical protein